MSTAALPDFLHAGIGGEIALDYDPSEFVPKIWIDIRDALSKFDGTMAIVDNTTVVNAVTLMRDGLGLENHSLDEATRLPDLHVLVFALTHFDRVIFFDHGRARGINEETLLAVQHFCEEAVLPVRLFTDSKVDYHVQCDFQKKFTDLERGFFDRSDLFDSWRKTWASLLGGEIDDPVPMTLDSHNLPHRSLNIDIQHVLRSPKHPLQLDGNMGTPKIPAGPNRWPHLGGERISDALKRSVYASYHTYRSMFYHSLSTFLGSPYLPSGLRACASHVLPICDQIDEQTVQDRHFVVELEKYVASKRLHAFLPVLRVSPSLAIAFDLLKDELEKGRSPEAAWPDVIRKLRKKSSRYRKLVADLLESCAKGDASTMDDNLRELTQSAPDFAEAGVSASRAVVQTAIGDTDGILDFLGVLAKNPFETIRRIRNRWRLRFILEARDLASKALALESQCREIWGRGFTEREKEYLAALSQSKTSNSLSIGA